MNLVESKASITFYGGAGTVTGANFLFDTGDTKILIDCGALEREPAHIASAHGATVQQNTSHVCDTENSKPFAYDPASIDVLIISHAHADHIGRVPRLIRSGFKGVIYSTAATRDLAALMFADAMNVMRRDTELHGCPSLYEKDDVERTLELWHTHEYHEAFTVGTAHIELLDAGHILGSAMIRLTRNGRSIIFTGDLGNSPEPLLNDTESPEGANYIVMESVYGDRAHEGRDERSDLLESAIESTRERGGVLLIPSFSIERTQILLFEIEKMIEHGMKPIDVYLDAPLAIAVTEVFRRYRTLLNPDARAHFEDGNDPFTFKNLHVIKDVSESHKIHAAPDPKVIIAGAGMSVGGRIRAHETKYLPDPNATVLFVGYQAPGSLGRRIQEGQKDVRIDGEQVRVQATIGSLTGYSGHRDRDGLLEFVEHAGEKLEKVFVVMGEPKAELFLSQRIHDFLGREAHVPGAGENVEIEW
jgi:metallo-beta-lactamase family protein